MPYYLVKEGEHSLAFGFEEDEKYLPKGAQTFETEKELNRVSEDMLAKCQDNLMAELDALDKEIARAESEELDRRI